MVCPLLTIVGRDEGLKQCEQEECAWWIPFYPTSDGDAKWNDHGLCSIKDFTTSLSGIMFDGLQIKNKEACMINTSTSVEVESVSYKSDNSISIKLVGSGETLCFKPTDVLDMFHGLLQALGLSNDDNLHFAVQDALTAADGTEEERIDSVAAAEEAAVALITELAG